MRLDRVHAVDLGAGTVPARDGLVVDVLPVVARIVAAVGDVTDDPLRRGDGRVRDSLGERLGDEVAGTHRDLPPAGYRSVA